MEAKGVLFVGYYPKNSQKLEILSSFSNLCQSKFGPRIEVQSDRKKSIRSS